MPTTSGHAASSGSSPSIRCRTHGRNTPEFLAAGAFDQYGHVVADGSAVEPGEFAMDGVFDLLGGQVRELLGQPSGHPVDLLRRVGVGRAWRHTCHRPGLLP